MVSMPQHVYFIPIKKLGPDRATTGEGVVWVRVFLGGLDGCEGFGLDCMSCGVGRGV